MPLRLFSAPAGCRGCRGALQKGAGGSAGHCCFSTGPLPLVRLVLPPWAAPNRAGSISARCKPLLSMQCGVSHSAEYRCVPLSSQAACKPWALHLLRSTQTRQGDCFKNIWQDRSHHCTSPPSPLLTIVQAAASAADAAAATQAGQHEQALAVLRQELQRAEGNRARQSAAAAEALAGARAAAAAARGAAEEAERARQAAEERLAAAQAENAGHALMCKRVRFAWLHDGGSQARSPSCWRAAMRRLISDARMRTRVVQ